jgi:prepilin-type N-terminal cleavage/methylation domain-containing protein
MNRPPLRTRPRHRGFTLVELLTVIGIIVVLVSILLPTVGKVRVQALVASTNQQIATIAGAIERYRLEQGGMPGAFTNAQFNTNGVLDPGNCRVRTIAVGTTPGPEITPTMTELMVLALCGGLKDPVGFNEVTYDPSYVGRGQSSLGPNAALRKKGTAFIDPTPGQMMPMQPWTNPNAPSTGSGKVGPNDTVIPEFMDRFGEGKAILFLRALKGAPGVVPPPPGGASNEAYPPGTTVTTAQYNPALLVPYGFPNSDAEFRADFPQDTAPDPDVPAGFGRYLKNPSVTGQARGKDAFILISAGPDNKYGTRDDILYP